MTRAYAPMAPGAGEKTRRSTVHGAARGGTIGIRSVRIGAEPTGWDGSKYSTETAVPMAHCECAATVSGTVVGNANVVVAARRAGNGGPALLSVLKPGDESSSSSLAVSSSYRIMRSARTA